MQEGLSITGRAHNACDVHGRIAKSGAAEVDDAADGGDRRVKQDVARPEVAVPQCGIVGEGRRVAEVSFEVALDTATAIRPHMRE